MSRSRLIDLAVGCAVGAFVLGFLRGAAPTVGAVVLVSAAAGAVALATAESFFETEPPYPGAGSASSLAPTLLAAGTFILRPPATTHPEVPAALKTLTPRKLDVLAAVARGMSNAEVGAKLFLSEGTVKTHVSHILAKLGLRDRVQAVVLAYETGLGRPDRS